MTDIRQIVAPLALQADEQAEWPPARLRVRTYLTTFSAVPGTWGERSSTSVQLQTVERADFQAALKMAWLGVAPKRLVVNEDHGS